MSRLTLKGVKEYTSESTAAMVRPVYNQMGCDNVAEFFETCDNVAGHGAACGFNGFIYYSETVAFFRAHRSAIVRMVSELADDLGEDALTMVKSFKCLNNCYDYDDVARAMYGRYDDDLTQIYNALSWYALEEVANAASNYKYENK